LSEGLGFSVVEMLIVFFFFFLHVFNWLAQNFVEETPLVHSTSTGRPSMPTRAAVPLVPPNNAPLRTAVSLPSMESPSAIMQSNKRWTILHHYILNNRENKKGNMFLP
jgi:hypothetical protein